MHKGRVDLTEGPVGGHLISLGAFLALHVVFILTLSLVDIYFVARLGHLQLAALTFTFPVLLIVSAISLGLGNGVMAVVARAFGEGDRDVIRVLATDGIMLGVMITVVMAVAGYFTVEPMFRLMGASPEVMPYIRQYMDVWYLSVGVQVIPSMAQSVIRASGDTRTPTMVSAVMCTLVVILDPLLIFGWGPVPALGIQGAAVANAVARLFSMTAMLSVLHFRLHAMAPVSLAWTRLHQSWGKLLYVGFPSMSAQLAGPVSTAILTKIVALSGIVAVAAFGVASRIEMLTAIYLWAIAGSMTAFVGQNAGAGRMDRVGKAVDLATKFCMLAGVGLVLAAVLAGTKIVSQFSDIPEIKTLAVYYLQIVSLGYGLTGLVLVASQTMNALRRPLPAAAVNLARTIGVTVPFALVGHWLGQIHGVFIAIALAGASCGAVAWFTMTSIVAHESRRQEMVENIS